MNKKIMLSGALALTFLVGAIGAFALSDVSVTSVAVENTGDVDTQTTSTCLDLQSTNLRYRSNDATTNGEVSDLQDFLITKSILKTQATGFFGLSTFAAVRFYQTSLGINPTGYVGPLTKAQIKAESCGMTTTQPVDGVKQKPDAPRMCTMEARMCPDGSMMPRDANCGWHPEKCPTLESKKAITDIPTCLTMEYRACPNGKPMPRQGCSWLPEKCTGDDATSINPLNTVSPKQAVQGGANPPVDQTIIKPIYSKPVLCTTETRLCPNGTAMKRNMATCEWVPLSCGAATTTTRVPGLPVVTPPEIITVPGGLTPKPGAVACTMVMRFCPNGEPMQRDEMCGWHPEKCGPGDGTTGGMQCTKDAVSGQVYCGAPGAIPSAY